MKDIFDLSEILGDDFLGDGFLESDDLGDLEIDDLFDESGNNEIPERPTAKLEGDTTSQLPGGEQPGTRPKDETKIMTGNGTEIKADVYNSAMGALKKSFKEASELIDMLSNCTVVESTLEDQQQEFTDNAVLESYLNGPLFEKVDREDKDEVKEIVSKIKSGLYSTCKEEGVTFYQPSVVGRWIGQGYFWLMRLWQIAGAVVTERSNIDDFCKHLTEKFKDDLGEYKIVPVAVLPSWFDAFRVMNNWKNLQQPFFLLIDRKLDHELSQKDKQARRDYQKEVKALQDKKGKK